MSNIVILTGKPGSGKGTQGKILAEKRGWTHFSTGAEFKKLRDEDSVLGHRVKEVFDSGQLLPDWFATYLVQKILFSLSETDGVVLEGYPRSVAQAQTLDEILAWLGRTYRVVDLEVSDEEVTERMIKRATLEHRPDSTTAEQIAVRLAAYQKHTAPVLDFFKQNNTLTSVDGTGTMEEIAGQIDVVLS